MDIKLKVLNKRRAHPPQDQDAGNNVGVEDVICSGEGGREQSAERSGAWTAEDVGDSSFFTVCLGEGSAKPGLRLFVRKE